MLDKPNMDALIAGIFTLIGLVVGGVLQYAVSRATTRETRIHDLRAEAYADFMRAMAAVSADSQGGVVDSKLSILQIEHDARLRACIFADATVIQAITVWHSESRQLQDDLFLDIVVAMRRSVLQVSELVDRETIRPILHGPGRRSD